MISKLIGLLKAALYFLIYRNKIVFKGLPSIHASTRINIKQGKCTLGKGLTIKPGAYFAIINNGKLVIDNFTHIGRNCNIVCHDSITIGERCGFGPNVVIYDHDHCFGEKGPTEGFHTSPVIIGSNCWVGAGAIILRGTTIGEGSIIGAGVVVKGNIPPYSLVVSNRELEIIPLSSRKVLTKEM